MSSYRFYLSVFLLISAVNVQASWDNFNENPFTLYPPGCATNLEEIVLSTGGQELIVSGVLDADSVGEATVPVFLELFRIGCADANRSVLVLTLEVVESDNGQNDQARIPTFYLVNDNKVGRLRPTRDPNTNQADATGTLIFESLGRQTFYLDSVTPFQADFEFWDDLFPDDFNDGFELEIAQRVAPDFVIDVSDYTDELQPDSMPLNGRHSGVWVSDGASDQGFVISFSELEGNFTEGVIFFSWYTFDAEGNNVWLVGNTNFAHGDTEVELELLWVTDGSFLGDRTAARTSAGSAIISARNCATLDMSYVLEALGLGSGIIELKRISKLETMGYNCMDAQTRSGISN